MFFDGLRETKIPYTFLVAEGIPRLFELLDPEVDLLPLLPQMTQSIRAALLSKDKVYLREAQKS